MTFPKYLWVSKSGNIYIRWDQQPVILYKLDEKYSRMVLSVNGYSITGTEAEEAFQHFQNYIETLAS